ncbi:HupE/UreJ family protein [Ekhidna sp.]|uniref:HupE/UreJ family protein n=1 Tax=Ekhidna sp. TaxID=2608089 RepID=UPI003B59A50A
MSEFSLYYELGLDHILDVNGYDHILFVVVLCALYQSTDWKKVLILITAFTLGHSITLALATMRIIKINADLIEFLIPVTILVTAISNLFTKEDRIAEGKIWRNYGYAGFFGLIHGLGFSNYLRALLGKDETIILQLFAFNVGLEVGQIIIVGLFMAISFIFVGLGGVTRRDWKMIISSAVGGIALMLMMDTNYLN